MPAARVHGLHYSYVTGRGGAEVRSIRKHSDRCAVEGHNPPHFHVIGPDFHVLVGIETMEVIAGTVPRKALAEAVEWARTHADELLIEWKRLNERD